MSADPIVRALQTPGNLRFFENLPFRDGLDRAGGRVISQSTGHLLFFRSDGRRFLATDPEGNPLHECGWGLDKNGQVALQRARVKLDWGAWVGLKPSGLVNETSLNLATKPGWQRLRADDLRGMAAQALRVPPDEVRWFYHDEDLVIGPTGHATIRHRKDAFYVLEEGDFDRARFMSCMGAMHWAAIDFLPVVELFKSLLPGTGSAVFELIRGLYDDQNESQSAPRRLRYRGIPTYPSEAAFRLFSSFFSPSVRGTSNPFTLFMDPTSAHQVEWLPSPTPPRRYFDAARGCCLTVQGGTLQKVTMMEDSAGLPYLNPKGRRFVPGDRTAQIVEGKIVLKDHNQEIALATALPEKCHEQPMQAVPMSPVDWRALFVKGMPPISPREAFSAVLLYPQDETEIGELAAQPFVADYLQDLIEQDREIGTLVTRAERVLIENGDAAIATCIPFDRPRKYIVRIRVPAFAQRQAQQLWNVCAELQRWDWLSRIGFLRTGEAEEHAGSQDFYDLVYHWVPYSLESNQSLLLERMKAVSKGLKPGGQGFVVGPAGLGAVWGSSGLHVCWQELVEQLPTFRMHRTILPKARLKPGLTVFHLRKV
jgi:hypothetical protein